MTCYKFNLPFCCITITLASGFAAIPRAKGCSRVLWNDNKLAVVVGRSMDWPVSTDPVLTLLPRGMMRDGGRLGTQVVVKENPLTWQSKYGSLVTSMYGLGAADGLNERGLAAHMLALHAADFGPRDPKKPGLNAGLWVQYLLDNAATVPEALGLLEKVQVVLTEARGAKAAVHLAIEDSSGDSAIIEYIDGKQVVHHGRQFKVMTNDPPYDKQLALLEKLDMSHPTSATPLPGNVTPTDRFQRATYFLATLPEPKNEREAVTGMLAVIRNVSVPFGAPRQDRTTISDTEYRTVIDLTQKRYFFELTSGLGVIWADLSGFNLAENAPVMVLNPKDPELSGDVSHKFQKSPKAPF